MSQKITLANKFQKVYFTMTPQHQPNMLLLEWDGFVASKEDALQGMNMSVEYAQKHQCTLVLNDNLKGQGPWPINQEETNEWLQGLKYAGVTKLAHVLATQVFSAISADQLNEKHSILDLQYFQSRQEAEAWLKS